jgi:hypothetical protein
MQQPFGTGSPIAGTVGGLGAESDIGGEEITAPAAREEPT